MVNKFAYEYDKKNTQNIALCPLGSIVDGACATSI